MQRLPVVEEAAGEVDCVRCLHSGRLGFDLGRMSQNFQTGSRLRCCHLGHRGILQARLLRCRWLGGYVFDLC